MKCLRILMMLSLLLVTGNAFGIKVKTDYDRSFDFGRLRTFAFEDQRRPDGSLLQRNTLENDRIRDALRRERSDLFHSQQELENVDLTKQSAIRVNISTVSPMLRLPTVRYRVGEQIPVTIKLTNTSTQPTYACVSSDLYQDLPRLTKNGELLPYTKWQSDLLRNDQEDQTCQNYNLPERQLLRSNEPTVVDFLIIADDSQVPTGAQSWYGSLTPGVYELSIQRRFDCCAGPMVESNKISFEVVP